MIRLVLLAEVTDVKQSPKHILIFLLMPHSPLFSLCLPTCLVEIHILWPTNVMIQVIPCSLRDCFGSLLDQGKWLCDSFLFLLTIKRDRFNPWLQVQTLRLWKGAEWKIEHALDSHTKPVTCQLSKDHCFCDFAILFSVPHRCGRSHLSSCEVSCSSLLAISEGSYKHLLWCRYSQQ